MTDTTSPDTFDRPPQIVQERLALGSKAVLVTERADADSGDIAAKWANGAPGPNPIVTFRATRLLTSQVLARIPSTSQGQRIHIAAAQILSALRSVFVLDPVPHQMRQYVPRRDLLLRRNADNLSAAAASLLEDPATSSGLCVALSRLNEQDVINVNISRSDLDYVMLTLTELFEGREHPVPARVMSDGSLRFLAILVSLLQAPTVDTAPEHLASEDALGQTALVIEELENGLHASQAGLLIGLVRDEVRHRRIRALATAHSP